VFSNSHRVRARTLAKVSGKIIAMTPAVGFITQIMTRCMFSALNEKLDRNSNLNIYQQTRLHTTTDVLEIKHCQCKTCIFIRERIYDIFTDASDVGAAGFY
jgi:hypothetical protein